MNTLSHFQVRNSKDDETPIESATQIFASVLPYPYIPTWKRLLVRPKTFAFELYLLNQTVHFYLSCPSLSDTFVQSLVTSSYPQAALTKTNDPVDVVLKSRFVATGELLLNSSFYYPIKTYLDFKDIDPLASLIGYLSRQAPDVKVAIQILVTPASFPWQSLSMNFAQKLVLDSASGRYSQNPQKLRVTQKASFQGGRTVIRLILGSDTQDPIQTLRNFAGTFGSYSLGEGNQLVFRRRLFFKDRFIKRIKDRRIGHVEHRHQVLNSQELASLWHPPGYLLAGLKNIAWGKTLKGEPPENLPVSSEKFNVQSESANKKQQDPERDVNFFAETEFKNKKEIFGITTVDRRKHVYIIGKTGAGKSTLIANMAIDDVRRGRGMAIIDPHGDLSSIILDYIPARRINDVVYLEPFDTSRPFSLNVLEVKNKQHKDLVASGIVSIFFKLYGDSWGPRLEYILRNIILTLLEVPDATLVDVLKLLSDARFRAEIVKDYVTDPVIKSFWQDEFARMPDKMRQEAISPIQNKVGQFVSSKMIRNIIGSPRSTLDLGKIMDEGKILILNLSQGKLGEDNAALLGAMIITQVQLAAMGRSYQKEEDRRDFFLYVDEFQNFATSSFIKILSEARKYRLSLTLANQYIDQLEEPVRNAIFGNVGTLVSFVMGARDAYILTKEFAELYTENDLVSLGKYEIILKLSVDGMTSAPFPATTLPLPALKNNNREKIVRLSKERFGRKA